MLESENENEHIPASKVAIVNLARSLVSITRGQGQLTVGAVPLLSLYSVHCGHACHAYEGLVPATSPHSPCAE